MSRPRGIDRGPVFKWLAAQTERVTDREIAERYGCSPAQGGRLRAEFEASPLPAEVPQDELPLPRWCEPRFPRRRYRIDDAFPADRENAL
jgi:hypothetical protein